MMAFFDLETAMFCDPNHPTSATFLADGTLGAPKHFAAQFCFMGAGGCCVGAEGTSREK